MPRAVLLNSAEDDLAEIWRFIARDNPEAASRFVRRLREVCGTTLASNPYVGRPSDELSQGMRRFAYQRYLIFYRLIDDGVEVVHVYQGSRDIESLFQQ